MSGTAVVISECEECTLVLASSILLKNLPDQKLDHLSQDIQTPEEHSCKTDDLI